MPFYRWTDRPSTYVLVAAAAVASLLVASFGFDQWVRHDDAIARAERDTRSAAALLAEHMARSFDAADEALRAVARVHDDVQAGRVANEPATIYTLLKAIHGGSPIFRSIGLIDAQGNRTASSLFADPPPLNVADQEQFVAVRDGMGGEDRLYVALPIRSRILDSWILSVSLRLNNPDGSFNGIAAGAVDPEYFAGVYRRIELGESRVVTLFRGDGAILVREPTDEALLGQSLAGRPFMTEIVSRAPIGTFHAWGLSDNVERIIGFARVPGGDFIITVAVSHAEALAAFWRHFGYGGARIAAMLVVLAIGTWLLVAMIRRHEQLADAERAAREAADEASRAKSDFLSRMSHELRTPLNAVIGFAQMLELNRPGNLQPQQKEYCRHIVQGGRHLLGLVNEVLDLAGVEAGRLALSPERVALAGVIAEAVESMRPMAEKYGVRLESLRELRIPDIRADVQRLRQVLLNLLSNAIKYNRPRGSVTLTAFPAGTDHVRVSVIDTGMGIAAESQDHVFEPFHRLGAEYTTIEGTGIGLALSKRLVEAMGGRIGFMTAPGKGSTFWIELPVDTGQPSETPAAPEVPAAIASGGFSILYVEDNPASVSLMEHLIGTLPNVALITAPNGRMALDLVRVHRPNVVVLDVNLPGLSGLEVLEQLKARPETRHVPVIALSAAAMPGDIKRGVAAGFFRYLTKPLDVNSFLGAVEAALATHSQQTASEG